MWPAGDLPGTAAGEILVSEYSRKTGYGRAYTDNAAFIVSLPGRRSFSPDVAYTEVSEREANSWRALPPLPRK